MNVTQPIFKKLTLNRQVFIKRWCMEFHEALTEGLVADTTPHTHRRLHISRSVFLSKHVQI